MYDDRNTTHGLLEIRFETTLLQHGTKQDISPNLITMAPATILLSSILALPTVVSSGPATARKWPLVGWDAFRTYDFYTLRPGDTTYMFSSYDRTNKNDDGFVCF